MTRYPATMTAPAYVLTMTEKQWQALVIEAATLLGWDCFHFPQMIGNPRGWPDCVLIRNGETRYLELKTEKGKLNEPQRLLHERFAANGVTVSVFRPSQWDDLVRVLQNDGASVRYTSVE